MKISSYLPDIGQEYNNDFITANLYPWTDVKRVLMDTKTGAIVQNLNKDNSYLDEDGNKSKYDETKHDIMVKIPVHYTQRVWVGNTCTDKILTVKPVALTYGSYTIPQCFIRDDGSIMPYILVGMTEGCVIDNQPTVLRSIIGRSPQVSKTQSEFRDMARQGRDATKFGILDFETLTMIQNLYKCSFGTTNSQKAIGLGWTNKTAPCTTGSTMTLGNRSGYYAPFDSGDKPDKRISLAMGFRDGKFEYWNNFSDKMPITGIDGIKVIEDTEDYTIYSDGTTVDIENYVSGTHDKYLTVLSDKAEKEEAKVKGLRSKRELSEYDQFFKGDVVQSEDLLNYINIKAIEEIANTPSTLDEPDGLAPHSMVAIQGETRTIPVAVDCTFMVRKDTKDIYIGEGYENFASANSAYGMSTIQTRVEGGYTYVEILSGTTTAGNFLAIGTKSAIACEIGDIASASADVELLEWAGVNQIRITLGNSVRDLNIGVNTNVSRPGFTASSTSNLTPFIGRNSVEPIDFSITPFRMRYKNTMQLTKTPTIKPYVKTSCPSGKLGLITDATTNTHSFIFKDTYMTTSGQPFFSHYDGAGGENFGRMFVGAGSCLASNLFVDGCVIANKGINNTGVYQNWYWSGNAMDSFKQILIYKGNLTENELKTENAKAILIPNINTNAFPAKVNSLFKPCGMMDSVYGNGNAISVFGIENFYGSCWKNIDGFLVEDDGYYIAKKSTDYGDKSKMKFYPNNNVVTGVEVNTLQEFYFKNVEKINSYNIPISSGGSSTTCYSDYFWNHRKTQSNILLFGCDWSNGAQAGAFAFNLGDVVSDSDSRIASLLCVKS